MRACPNWIDADSFREELERSVALRGRLQRQQLIHCSRGQITVLDRPRLEQLCCECYSVVKREADRIERLATPPGN